MKARALVLGLALITLLVGTPVVSAAQSQPTRPVAQESLSTGGFIQWLLNHQEGIATGGFIQWVIDRVNAR